MENFELVEKLVNTFGVSYEKAKEALEASNWDAVDAAIYLEREKNGIPHPTREEASQESAKEQPSGVNTGTKGSVNAQGCDWKQEGGKFFKTIWDFLSLNSFVVKKSSGELFLDIPLWLMILLVCAFFWAVVLILGIVFIMGYRFSFSGPQLGKKNIKNTMDHMENVTEEFVEKVKNTVAPDSVEPVAQENTEPEIVPDPSESILKTASEAEEKTEDNGADIPPASDSEQ